MPPDHPRITLAHAVAILEVRYAGIYVDHRRAVLPVRDALAGYIEARGFDAAVRLVPGVDMGWVTFDPAPGVHPSRWFGTFEWVGIEERMPHFPWRAVWSVPCVRTTTRSEARARTDGKVDTPGGVRSSGRGGSG